MTKSWKPKLKDQDTPTYIAIVESLRSDIASSRLLPGDRLPTHRDLAEYLGVAVGTITKAYREAERQGLIYGDGRRGTFVGSPPERRDERRGAPSDQTRVIDLSSYVPPTEHDPDIMATLSNLASRRETQHLMRYTRATGYDYHRAAGARWLTSYGIKASADDIVITSGAQHAIFSILLAAAEKGDVVATELHGYPGIKFAAEHLGLEVVGIEGDDGGMIPDALEAQCRERNVRLLYLVPTFNNPTNTVLSAERKQAIAAIAEKYGIEIIEDEINYKLLSDRSPVIKSLVPDRCYLITTLAKIVAGGLRIAYVAPPAGRRDGLLSALHTTTLMVSPLLAEIAAIWINDGTADRSIADKARELKVRNKAVNSILKGFRFRSWPTSYFVWLVLPDNLRSTVFEAEAERERIVLAHACCFAVDPDRMANAVRIGIGGAIDLDNLKGALATLAKILRGHGVSEPVIL
jgi:DNA-binding transcriptional MocR family regulator